jgi:hypothetical protein
VEFLTSDSTVTMLGVLLEGGSLSKQGALLTGQCSAEMALVRGISYHEPAERCQEGRDHHSDERELIVGKTPPRESAIVGCYRP